MALSVISWPSTATANITHQLIMLHGFGANAQNLSGLAPELDVPDYQFQFLNAPFAHPQVPGGAMWYDLFDGAYTGVVESRQLLQDYLRALPAQTGIALNRTVLAGFSQGGAMALDVGLGLPLAGLVVFSGYLHPLDAGAKGEDWPPILMIHGRQDRVVALTMAQQAAETLTTAGAQLNYYELDMGHEISLQATQIAHQWLQGR